MTRINAFIQPADLSDKHLLAEHREIKRIPNTIKSGKAVIKDIPERFTLGKGHVKFFYDKLYWLHLRYKLIYAECLKRGFNVTDYNDAFNSWNGNMEIKMDRYMELYQNWLPDKQEILRIREIVMYRIEQNIEKARLKKGSI